MEAFIDESIRLSRQHGYNPTTFIVMRARLGTIDAIAQLMVSGEIQSGFKRLRQLGLLEWSIEAAVTKFPDEFPRQIREAAEWRLQQAKRAKGT